MGHTDHHQPTDDPTMMLKDKWQIPKTIKTASGPVATEGTETKAVFVPRK